MAWFRFYDEALDDPKVQQLPAEQFKAWVNLLCLAKRNDGHIPCLQDIAFALRMPESRAYALRQKLIEAGLIDDVDGVLQPHNWDGRQFQSDDSNERVRRFRERQRNGKCNVTETPNETAPEQNRADTEQNRADIAPKRTPKKTQLKIDSIPDDWLLYCKTKRPELNPQETFTNFREFYLSHARPMADWKLTWQRWVREEKRYGKAQHRTGETAIQARDRRNREAIIAAGGSQAAGDGGPMGAHGSDLPAMGNPLR